MSLDKFLYILQQPYVVRALIIGGLVAVCAAMLGVILVLKKYSLIGHALSDVGFASLSLAVAINFSPFITSVVVMIIASFVIMNINRKNGGDVIIGMIATGSLAVGIIITSLSSGFNIDVSGYMFGSILGTERIDVFYTVVLAIVVIGSFVLFYQRIFLITYDEKFAATLGINVSLYQFLISTLTALTIVIGMRLLGTLLMSSFIIFPAMTSRKYVKSFSGLIIFACIDSLVCFLIGMSLSIVYDLPTGACIVGVNIIVWAVSTLIKRNSHES